MFCQQSVKQNCESEFLYGYDEDRRYIIHDFLCCSNCTVMQLAI